MTPVKAKQRIKIHIHQKLSVKKSIRVKLVLLFRSEYGDPGEKGANPPTIGSEQSYYKVSDVKIIFL